MDLEKLMQNFKTLIESLSNDEMQAETQKAVHDSRDSFILDGDNFLSENP